MNIEQIASEVLKLSPHDRAMLAETLWESLETPYLVVPELSDDEAIVLAKRRDSEIENGEVEPLSHTQLMARLRNAG
ncbi:addiction module protein [Methylobacter sp.]|uniref:addiction module protein n=1 Tax=Methylobacter sp. TaxID=2051955 RepID=UPI002FDCAB45